MTSTSTQTRQAGRRRARFPKKSTIVFAISVLLFTAALLAASDYLSRVGAQSLLARAVQRDMNAPHRPSVHVRGTFFLPQVVHGVYNDVEIKVAPVTNGPMRIASVRANLYRVHLPLHDVIVRHAKRIVIERTSELATLRYSDIDNYLHSIGTPVSLSPAGHGLVRFTGTVSVLGNSVSASADARVSASGNVLRIVPVRFDSGLSGLDAASKALLGQRFTVDIPLQKLPFGQNITGIQVHSHSIAVHAQARDVVILPNG